MGLGRRKYPLEALFWGDLFHHVLFERRRTDIGEEMGGDISAAGAATVAVVDGEQQGAGRSASSDGVEVLDRLVCRQLTDVNPLHHSFICNPLLYMGSNLLLTFN